MSNAESILNEDKIFAALADKNRRKILELLHAGDSTLLELNKSFPISFQALGKHIKILENAHLLTKETQGKYRKLSLNREALGVSMKWIAYFSDFWNQSFDKLSQQIDHNEKHDQ
ncbi:MAG: winged helix-turn-helix transcriptional regulator [Roseivirga sp.]|nr:winged helix-turn-helix transcriptional regulator [Roseivirga sp.]